MVIIKYIFNLPTNFTGKTYDSVSKTFRKNKQIHRCYGPAYIRYIFNNYKSWYFNGKCFGSSDDNYSQKEFLKDVSKQWLS